MNAPYPRMRRSALGRQIQSPCHPEHLAEVSQRLTASSEPRRRVAELVADIDLEQSIVRSEQTDAEQIQSPRALVAPLSARQVPSCQVGESRPAMVSTLVIRDCHVLALRARRRGADPGFNPLGRETPVLGQNPRVNCSFDEGTHGRFNKGPRSLTTVQDLGIGLLYEASFLQRHCQSFGFLDGRIRGKHHGRIPGIGTDAPHGHYAAGPKYRPHGHPTAEQLALGRRQRGHTRLGCRFRAECDGLLSGALHVEQPRTRGGRHQNAVLVIHAEELLEQEGIATGLDGCPLRQPGRQLLCAERALDEDIHLERRKRLHVNPSVAAFLFHPLGPAHEQLGPSRGHHHDGCFAQLGRQALQDIQ